MCTGMQDNCPGRGTEHVLGGRDPGTGFVGWPVPVSVRSGQWVALAVSTGISTFTCVIKKFQRNVLRSYL